jgi:hypothetical protein
VFTIDFEMSSTCFEVVLVSLSVLLSITEGEFLISVMSFSDCGARFSTVTEDNLLFVFFALCCCVFM